jgi:hypothetical protein
MLIYQVIDRTDSGYHQKPTFYLTRKLADKQVEKLRAKHEPYAHKFIYWEQVTVEEEKFEVNTCWKARATSSICENCGKPWNTHKGQWWDCEISP